MKHLKEFKYFERFGIITEMEEQVSRYMLEIKNNPTKKSFRFEYRMSTKKGTIFIPFYLSFDKNLVGEGEMESETKVFGGYKFSIVMKRRDDEGTLLHELKHIDYFNRVDDCYKDLFFIANNEVKSNKNNNINIPAFRSIFYSYTENEFQSKYTSYYKDFDQQVSKMQNPTSSSIIDAFNSFLKNHADGTWGWYLTDREFKFNKYATQDQINLLFHNVIIPVMKKQDVNQDVDVTFYNVYNMIKALWDKIKELLFGKKLIELTPQQQLEVNKAVKTIEDNINKKRKRYNIKFKKIIPFMIEKYVK